MSSPKTQGFALSALPRSGNIPNNVGAVDVKSIYDGVRQGLAAFENVRRAPASMILADEAAATNIAEVQAKRETLPVQTAAVLADTPNRSAILSGQAQIAQRGVPLALAEIGGREQQMARAQAAQQKAAAEISQFTEDYAAAKRFADPRTEADELEKLAIKYPWIDTVPEYKPTAARIKEAIGAARANAQKTADRESAETRANIVAQGGVEKAKVGAGPKSGVAALVKLMIDEGFADEEINNVINKQGASEVASPAADRASREKVAQARITAQTEAQRANRELKLNQIDSTHQQKMSHALGALESLENNTKHVNDLIDEAIALTDSTSAGLAKNLAFLPGGARTLRGKLDSIRSNIGFDALANMRQNSPTGGALGAVSDNENKLLQSTIEALDQGLSPEILRQNLESVRNQRKISLDNLNRTYQRDAEILSRPAGGATATTAPGAATPVRAFANEAEAAAAAARKEITTGTPITVGGVPGTWK